MRSDPTRVDPEERKREKKENSGSERRVLRQGVFKEGEEGLGEGGERVGGRSWGRGRGRGSPGNAWGIFDRWIWLRFFSVDGRDLEIRGRMEDERSGRLVSLSRGDVLEST